jgi:hypothetical protein
MQSTVGRGVEAASRIRPLAPGEAGWALALNNAAAPAVNPLEPEAFERLLGWSDSCLMAEVDGAPAGFVLALPGPGLPYESLNYRWFSSRYERFQYVDRVVVDPAIRSRGLGGALYAELGRLASGAYPRICAEVNLRPPNPRSLAFHQRTGFRAVGEQDTEGGAKRVVLLSWELGDG